MRKADRMTNAQAAALIVALERLHEIATPAQYRETLRRMRETLTTAKATEESKKTSDTAQK